MRAGLRRPAETRPKIGTSVWIIVRNNGHEGYGLPQMVFSTEEEANRALKIPSDWDSFEVHEVPFWIPVSTGAAP